jgi:hypothetical protein
MNKHITNMVYTKDSQRCISFSKELNYLKHFPNKTCKFQKQNNIINTLQKVDCKVLIGWLPTKHDWLTQFFGYWLIGGHTLTTIMGEM